MGELPGAVLFDLDGTLLESEQLWMQSAVEVMNALGSVWSDEDQAKFIGGPLISLLYLAITIGYLAKGGYLSQLEKHEKKDG